MMRSVYSGISGMKAHQIMMDVIGNNIANVNTFGFKRGRVVFSDILSETLGYSTAPTNTNGGINAKQVGLGSMPAAIDNIMTQGALQSTGRINDLAIEGEGFFIVSNGLQDLYLRAGNFQIDGSGNLVHSSSGCVVKGWMAEENPLTKEFEIQTARPPAAINFQEREKLQAKATTKVEYRSNLRSSANERSLPEERTMTFVDDKGTEQTLKFKFNKIDMNNWSWVAIDDTEGQVGIGTLSFDDNGKIISSTGGPYLEYDPDGASGTPASATLRPNNTAGITSIQLMPLQAQEYIMTMRFAKGDIQVSNDSYKLCELYDLVDDPNPVGDERFDLRNIDGTQRLYVSGEDGNGNIILDRELVLTRDTTIADVVNFLNSTFPNATASFDPTTGKIKMVDASPGAAGDFRFSFKYVDPLGPGNTKFPGVTTATTLSGAVAGGTVQSVAGVGTVKSGTHSINVTKIDATAPTVNGQVSGLTRFTTFAQLDIGDVSHFQIAIDGGNFITLTGLAAGTAARQVAANQVAGADVGEIPVPGQITINGYTTSWDDSVAMARYGVNLASLTQDQFGTLIADQINTTHNAVEGSAPQFAVYASYDSTTNLLTLTQRRRGSDYKIDVQPPTSTQTGFDPFAPIAYGTNGSTIGDLIDAINNQIPEAIAEIRGDRVYIKRAVTGQSFNIQVRDANGGPGIPPVTNWVTRNVSAPVPSSYSIAQQILGDSNPVTTPGSDLSYTLTDLFTPDDNSGTLTFIYNDFRDGQIIGNDQVGRILINAPNLQAGTASIVTVGERDAGKVKISVPTVNSYNAEFKVATGGTRAIPVNVQMVKGGTHAASTTVYDSLGRPHQLTIEFEKVEASTWQYSARLADDDPLILDYFRTAPYQGSSPTAIELAQANDAVLKNRRGKLVFNEYGRLDGEKTAEANSVSYPSLVKPFSFTPFDAETVTITPDFTAVTQYDSEFSTAARFQDGYEMGMLRSFDIDSNGAITGIYTNGFKQKIGQLALAAFNNPSGLQKVSESLWTTSANSGLPIVGPAQTGPRGKVSSGTLEMSNVDLAQEFTDMIVAQRGFQANARTITTADQLLQELVALKR